MSQLLTPLLAAVLVMFWPLHAAAQLRPVPPMEWRVFAQSGVHVSVAAGAFADQRVSLAGVRGDLIELGDVRIAVVSGRFMIDVAGTPQRFLRDEQFVEPATGGAQAMSADRSRHDAGDYRVTTAIALNDVTDGSFETLRFGTRLPTTDNKIGLERDQTDFFALLGAHRKWSRLRVGAEAGVGINGTRRPEYEQSDLLTYDVTVAYDAGSVQTALVLAGQNDLRSERTRGNEDLAELRGLLRIGARRWLQAGMVVGITEFSPRAGFVLGGGMHLSGTRE